MSWYTNIQGKFENLSKNWKVLLVLMFSVVMFVLVAGGLTLIINSGGSTTTQESETTDGTKHGLSESQRKEMYYQICKVQDGINPYDPQYNEKCAQVYDVAATTYGVTVDVARKVAVEGVQRGWMTP